jgi:hypothetical protein
MKRLLLSLAALGGIGLFAAPAMAGGHWHYRTHYRPCVVQACPAPCPPVVTTCAPAPVPCAPVVTTCAPRWHYNRYYGGHVGGYHVRRGWRCR